MKPGSIDQRHYYAMQKIGRDRAQRENLKNQQERAAARVARQPEKVRQIDLQLQRIEFLKMAAKLVTGPGELFKKFAAIAGPVALVTERYVNGKIGALIGRSIGLIQDEFLTFFGIQR